MPDPGRLHPEPPAVQTPRPSDPAPTPGPPGADAADSSRAGAALALLAKFGSPAALATVLLFYFGWTRMDAQARYLGYDSRVLDFSMQEYALKSIDVLFVPLLGLLVLAVLLYQLHRRVVIPVLQRYERTLFAWIVIVALLSSLLVWAAIGVQTARDAPRLSGLATALVATIAVLLVVYASSLHRRFCSSAPSSPTLRMMLIALLCLTIFWDTEQMARLVGDSRAAQIVDGGPGVVAVTVYSEKRLNITVAGVTEHATGQQDAAYAYRYDGLRLVQRSGDRYYLVSARWHASSRRVVVIRDNDSIRLEFSR